MAFTTIFKEHASHQRPSEGLGKDPLETAHAEAATAMSVSGGRVKLEIYEREKKPKSAVLADHTQGGGGFPFAHLLLACLPAACR